MEPVTLSLDLDQVARMSCCSVGRGPAGGTSQAARSVEPLELIPVPARAQAMTGTSGPFESLHGWVSDCLPGRGQDKDRSPVVQREPKLRDLAGVQLVPG